VSEHNWPVVPLRRVAEVVDCAHVTAEFIDDDDRFPIASIRECGGATVDLAGCNYTTLEFFEHLRASRRAPRVGDLLFVRNVSVGLVSVVPSGTPDFAVGQETVLLRRSSDVDPSFLRYALTAQTARHAIDSAMIGSTFRRINVSAIRALPVPVPTFREQMAIAAYLDRETAQIDDLIAEQERLIDLLVERRLAVASDVLALRIGTGERLKWLFTELDVRADEQPAELPLMSVSISWGVRRRDEVTVAESRAEDLSNYKVCRVGDLVINRMRAFQGALGLAPEDGIVSPDYAVLAIDGSVDAKWLSAVMKTAAFVAEMAQRVKGIGSADLGNARTPRINVSDLGEIRVDVPPISIQVSESRSVEAQASKIDSLIAETGRFIELARERRSALITAAVTGQIDLRGAA